MNQVNKGWLTFAAVIAVVAANGLGACQLPGTSTQDPSLTGTLKPMGALLTHSFGTGPGTSSPR
jgi:hypothetical protein